MLDKNLTSAELEKSFGSNTCRCTGYRPILDTMKSFATDASSELRQRVTDIEELHLCKNTGKQCLQKCTSDEDLEKCLEEYAKIDNLICIDFGKVRFYKVFEESDIFDVWKKEGVDSCMVIDGNTGRGVNENVEYRRVLIDISDVECLKTCKMDQNLILGGNVSLEDCIRIFKEFGDKFSEFAYLKEFVKHFELIAHIPVRKIGSVAGNLMLKHANPFYQSDVFLLFEAVGAAITIKNCEGQTQVMSLLEFLQYDMRGNLITELALPPYSEAHVFRSYKIMPRNQNALAIVNAAFLLKLDRSAPRVEAARLVFGNISRTFTHAVNTEKYLIQKRVFDDDTLQAAVKVLNDELVVVERLPEFSKECRKKLALGLFYKCILSVAPTGLVSSTLLSGGSLFERPVSKGTQDFQSDPSLYPLNQPVEKLEGQIQSSGEAQYANDDAPHSTRDVFGAFVLSTVATGQVDSIDVDQLQEIEGFLAIYTPKDIPGKNTFIRPGLQLLTEEEEILATNIKYCGQPIAIVVATTQQLASEIAKKINVKYKNTANTPPVLIIDEAKRDSKRNIPSESKIVPSGKGTDVTKVIKGVYEGGAQYHYYMEPITCVVIPVDKGFEVYDSSQWMDLTQIAIADCLGVKESDIIVQVRRVGGAFGGKISRNVQVSAACAIVAKLMNRPCRFILPIQTNLKITGKRYPFQCEYEVGINDEGKIQYLNANITEDAGCGNNDNVLSYVVEAFRHCYNVDYFTLNTAAVLTDLPSNTFLRAPGTAEGIASIEHIMEHIAFTIKKDSIAIKELNMRTDDNDLPSLIQDQKQRTDYENRAKAIEVFNKNNRWKKKAIKIGIMCFPVAYYGNYSAQVSIYRGDGTVTVTSGGIEMGQGLNTKAAQVCAYELGIPVENITVISSYTFTAANNVFSGSSITSESVCYSVIKACRILKERLEPIREKMPDATWKDIVKTAGDELINLTAEYMMTDKEEDLKPYDAYAVTVLETELDVLTGRFQIDRVDIIEDVGLSANPNLDVGQVEGGFIQGLGYFTCEKLVYDRSTGELMTNRSLTYHVPLACDIPVHFNVRLRYNSKNVGVMGSKTCGEMGICTAYTITHALRHCIMESRRDSGYDVEEWINIPLPYDSETILKALAVKPEEFIITK